MLRQLLECNDLVALKAVLSEVPVEELVARLRELHGRERAVAFRLLEKEKALEVFEAFDRFEQSELIRALEDPQIVTLLSSLDTDDQTQLLNELPAKVVKRIIRELPEEARERVSVVLGFSEGSSGRLLDPDYLALPQDTTVATALEQVRNAPLAPEDLEVVFALGPGRTYEGYVPLSRLVKAEADQPIQSLAEGKQTFVPAYASEEEAIHLFLAKRLNLLPVVDSEGRLLGVIHAERALARLQEQETARVTRFGGMLTLPPNRGDVDLLRDPLRRIYSARVIWLILLTIFGVVTSTFVAAQEEILQAAIVLAAFVAPIIDMGGNTGSQTATLVIRSMALGHVRPRIRDFLSVLRRDIPVAVSLGISIAGLEAILAYFSKGVGLDILLVVGLAMAAVTIVGSIVGILLPFIAKRLGADPATLSAPFITSIMDLTGVLIYFGLAYVFLGHLLE